ncbi:histidine kinase N-terminal 7TM domain-containing protein [Desulfosarcina alkanivorans]|uniref:histidine kinase N-terminal 7TM domain-containing protein n=1 Tax=Desulfosarcina alkanivorans TaxID=571177 RepID=UPI001E626FDE|nr:histidine kinase N-terminal 7TM domain-containing protein [Desulfosarcina alkanivorans]
MIDLQALYIFHSFAAAAISAALAVYLIPRWEVPAARCLLLLEGSVAAWSFCYGMEFWSATLAGKLWWVRMEYLGAAWTGVCYFRFAMALTGRMSWLQGARGWALFIVPAMTLAAVFTNAHHDLIWSRAWIETGGPIPVMAYHRGTGFWIFVAYSYGLLVAGTAALFYGYLFSRHIGNRHFWLIFIGIAAPWTSNLLYLLEFAPIRHIDLTPAAFAISGLTFFWGTLRQQMLELIPIARDAVIEGMQDAVFVLDIRDRVIDLNSSAQRLLAEPAGKPAGRPLSVVFPQLSAQVEQSRTSGSDDREVSIAGKTGTLHWRLRQSPIHSHGDRLCGRLVILQDITGQKANEAAIRESEEKFRSISASALDAIIMMDPEGRISFWNPAAEQIFGYREDEILGKDLHATLAPEAFHTRFSEAFTAFRRSGSGQMLGKTVEIECLRKSGDGFPAELSLSPLRLGSQWHTVGIVRDITERKKTQEYLIQTEKMSSLGGLAAGMAHEINNPLAGILANVQVMRMRLLSDLPANVAAADETGVDLNRLWAYMGKRGILEKIEAIDQSCQRAAAIVRNMLAFSRKSDAVLSDHDLAELLDQTVDMAENDFLIKKHQDFRHIRIERRYAPDMPRIVCDAGQIQQVMLNILKNGAQAMWGSGDRQPEPKFILRVDRQDAWGCITITDNGPGMTGETRKRIFEPFFTTKPTGSGTGLGLSIAYFIITENHAGRLFVESAPGRGTAFVIKLPLKPAP